MKNEIDLNAGANQLFVDASILLDQSQQLASSDLESAYRKGMEALQKLREILSDHTGSRIAVEMVSGLALYDLPKIREVEAKLEKYKELLDATENPTNLAIYTGNVILKKEVECDLQLLASALAETGDSNQALRFTRPDVDSMTTTATCLAKIGNLESAQKLCDLALTALKDEYFTENTINYLSEIAAVLVGTGQVEKALSIASKEMSEAEWESKEFTAKIQRAIACALAERGRIEDSLQIARNIERGEWKAKALSGIARLKSWNDAEREELFRDALKAAEEISYTVKRAWVHHSIIKSMLAVGNFKQAMDVHDQMDNSLSYKTDAIHTVIEAASETKEVSQLKEVYEWVQNMTPVTGLAFEWDPAVATHLAAAFASVQDYDNMEYLLAAASKNATEWYLHSYIAKVWAKAGAFETAISIVEGQECENEADKVKLICRIAILLNTFGDTKHSRVILEKALESARDIWDKNLQALALTYTAGALGQIGDLKGVRNVFEEAWIVIEPIRNRLNTSEAFVDYFFGWGIDPERVFGEVAEEYQPEGFERCRTKEHWDSIVSVFKLGLLIKTGDYREALSVVLQFQNPDFRTLSLCRLAFEMSIKNGQIKTSFTSEETSIAQEIVSRF